MCCYCLNGMYFFLSQSLNCFFDLPCLVLGRFECAFQFLRCVSRYIASNTIIISQYSNTTRKRKAKKICWGGRDIIIPCQQRLGYKPTRVCYTYDLHMKKQYSKYMQTLTRAGTIIIITILFLIYSDTHFLYILTCYMHFTFMSSFMTISPID